MRNYPKKQLRAITYYKHITSQTTHAAMVSVSVSVAKAGGKSNPSPTYSAMPSTRIAGGKTAYPSNTSGARIVNAETGTVTPFRVGSLDEDLFFKIADATKRNACGDADIFFYDSPDHYVRHRFSRIRYNMRSSRGSDQSAASFKRRIAMDKQRKDYMLENHDNETVHWTLVDSHGSPTDDYTRAYMQPHANPLVVNHWSSKKAHRAAQLSAVSLDIA